MSDLMKHLKFYVDTRNGDMIHLLAKVDSVSWGKCWMAEVTSKEQATVVCPMNPSADTTGWSEITQQQFRNAVLVNMKKAMSLPLPAELNKPSIRERILCAIESLFKRQKKTEKPALVVLSSTSEERELSKKK